ncbi:MAG TPA: VWA domain-containing protein, partial [Aggregatilineales bacterium]|nr:VWA domain-containing protein [Aggregatilineales bacterium]
MSFLAPLSLGLAALAIPVILLYMLRLRRRETQVSSTLLWQQVIHDREANAPWQKLRRNLLLLLQLLILAALVLALSRPFMEVPTVTTGKVALLIDASASMNATDVQPDRFEAARQQALNFISSINPQDKVAVIRVAREPEQVVNYSSDPNELRAGINKIQVSQTRADWVAALTLAASGAVGADKFTIVAIADGDIPDNLGSSYGDVKFIPVGRANDNVAISALATGNDPVNGPQIYGRITNYGTQSADVIFSIKLDGNLFNASPYMVPAQSSVDVVVTKLPGTFHQVEADLTRPAGSKVPDYLPLDDTAYAVYNPAKAGRVLLVTKQNVFLEQGFTSLGDWQVFRAEPDKVLPNQIYDLYVFDGSIPTNLPDANILFVNPSAATKLFSIGAATTATGSIQVKADDARTRFLKFNDVNIRTFESVTPTADYKADVLVNAAGGPLILAGDYQGHQVAVITFDLHDSDLPLRIAWPILLANLTSWYKTPHSIDVQGSLAPGTAVTITPPLDTDRIQVKGPDGAITPLKFDPAGAAPLVFSGTDRPG